MLLHGTGVKRDVTTGLARLQRLAETGHAEAQVALGRLLREGLPDLLPAAPDRAFELFKVASLKGSESATLEVARMQILGLGTVPAPREGLDALEQLVERDYHDAMLFLSELHETGLPGQMRADQEKAFTLASQVAETGRSDAVVRTARMLLNGHGVDRDVRRALALLRTAADQSDGETLFVLGDIYEGGIPNAVQPDADLASRYFLQAAEKGFRPAKIKLAKLVLNDDGVMDGTATAAEQFLEDLARTGDAEATELLSRFVVARFRDAERDDAADAAPASDRGGPVATALLELGELFEDGRIDPSDGQLALDYYLAQRDNNETVFSIIEPDSLIMVAQEGRWQPDMANAKRAYLLAGELGDPDGYLKVADILRKSSAKGEDGQTVADYLRRAAEMGSPDAEIRLAVLEIGAQTDLEAAQAKFARLKQLARDGHTLALYELGTLLLDGKAPLVSPDPAGAYAMIEPAAKGGYAPALVSIALMQIYGNGIPRSPAVGLAELQRLSDAGSAEAALASARVYDEGLPGILLRNPAHAFELYSTAAAAGSGSARLQRATMLMRGDGVAPDPAGALAILEEAGAEGDASAYLALATLYETGETDAVPKDARKAFEFFSRAADLGDSRAAMKVALMHLDNSVPASDQSSGLAILEGLASTGHTDAAYRLADYYSGEDGQAVSPDPALAFGYYQQAAEGGSGSARIRMAGMLIRGEGIARDVPRGIAILREEGAAGNATALLNLGDTFARGIAGRVDIEAALEAYEAASDLGNDTALVRLADIYRYGLLRKTSTSRAYEFLEKAAAQGNSYAVFMLGKGLVDGDFGDAGTVEDGERLLVQANLGNVAEAAVELALLDVPSVTEGATASSKVERLRNLAEGGNLAARLRLVEAYRDGHTGRGEALVSQDLARARAELAAIADQIDPAEREVQSMLIDLKSRKYSGYPETYARIKTLPWSERPSAVRRILDVNPNAYVYALQMQLAENGIYRDELDGMMTNRTISAIETQCDLLNAASLCRFGPLSPQVKTLMFYVF